MHCKSKVATCAYIEEVLECRVEESGMGWLRLEE